MLEHSLQGIALAAILVLGVITGAVAEGASASLKVTTKASGSTVSLLVQSAKKSAEPVYGFQIIFTQGSLANILKVRGWDGQDTGNGVKFTATQSPLKPGGKVAFKIKVADPASTAFQWKAFGSSGQELDSGEVNRIKVKTPAKPTITQAEISVSQSTIPQGGQVIVTGKGFTAQSTVEVLLDGQQVTISATNAKGAFTAVVIISSSFPAGSHIITARDSSDKSSIIQVLVSGEGGVTGPPTGPLMLTVLTDKAEYKPGETIRITGTAILESPVSLQVIDKRNTIICGSNPVVNNQTMTWESICLLPLDSETGTYMIIAKQVVHKTSVNINVQRDAGSTGPGGGSTEPGDDPGSLKISFDKAQYTSGETVKITVQGARSQSIVSIIILGPAALLHASEPLETDQAGSLTYEYKLLAATAGTYKVSAKQDKYKITGTFEVITQ